MLIFGLFINNINYLFIAIKLKYRTHRYLLIVGLLFVAKFLFLTHFSQLILSINIQNPYKVINSLDDLEARPQLKTTIFMPLTELQQIEVYFLFRPG